MRVGQGEEEVYKCKFIIKEKKNGNPNCHQHTTILVNKPINLKHKVCYSSNNGQSERMKQGK